MSFASLVFPERSVAWIDVSPATKFIYSHYELNSQEEIKQTHPGQILLGMEGHQVLVVLEVWEVWEV